MVYGIALCFAFLVVGLAFGTLMTGGYDSVIDVLRVLIGGSLLLSLANAYYYRKSGSRRLRLARWASVLVVPVFLWMAGITYINRYCCTGGLYCGHDGHEL